MAYSPLRQVVHADRHAIGLESRIRLHEIRERRDQEPGGNQQSLRRSELSDDQRRSQPRPYREDRLACVRGVKDRRSAGLPGGEDSGQHPCHEAHGRRDRQHAAIQLDIGDVGQPTGQHRHDDRQPDSRQDHAEDTCNDREREALAQKLLQQMDTSRAEREPDRELPRSRDTQHADQRRRVRAGDEQHEADRSPQCDQQVARRGNNALAERLDVNPHLAIRVRVQASQVHRNPVHGGSRLANRHPVRETADYGGPAPAASADLARLPSDRQEKLAVPIEHRIADSRGQHANDRVRQTIDDDGAADDRGITSIAPAPRIERDDDDGCRSRILPCWRWGCCCSCA